MNDISGSQSLVIITGGGSGIGLATARRILTDWPNVRVVSADLRKGEIEKVQDEFGTQRVLFCEANVSSSGSTAQLVEATVPGRVS